MKYWQEPLTISRGCSPVSAGCDHCWFRGLQHRFPGQMGDAGVVRFDPKPLEKLARAKRPRVWSVWADLFHEAIDEKDILVCLDHFERSKDQVVLVLTKRPERAERLWPRAIPNVWIGTSAEDQATFDARWPFIEKIWNRTIVGDRQKVFLSAEPLLGPIRLRDPERMGWMGAVVIAGPETGPGARPMQEEWIEQLHNDCLSVGSSQPYARLLRKDKEWTDFNALEFWR